MQGEEGALVALVQGALVQGGACLARLRLLCYGATPFPRRVSSNSRLISQFRQSPVISQIRQ